MFAVQQDVFSKIGFIVHFRTVFTTRWTPGTNPSTIGTTGGQTFSGITAGWQTYFNKANMFTLCIDGVVHVDHPVRMAQHQTQFDRCSITFQLLFHGTRCARCGYKTVPHPFV